MMSARDQPTPPFNSPYQQALKPTSLLHSPAYPSPARSDSEPSKYPTDGLGLYAYTPSYPTSGPPAATVLYPPSPQPTEAWTHLSTGTSPLITEASADPWTSSYDHAVSRSPLPWAPQHASHRSSLSSTRDMSIFSHDGSEHGFPSIKLEGTGEWGTEDDSSPPTLRNSIPLTVAPNRLSTSTFPYDHAYESPPIPKFESLKEDSYDEQDYDSMAYDPHERSPRSRINRAGVTARTRHRRNPTTPDNANFACHVCGKFFQRSYNHKTHMEIHNPQRKKDWICTIEDCTKVFVRKTDLDRHKKSVHYKIKDYDCLRCGRHFARKDTLRR